MDKWQALDSFWRSFGLPAYDEASVPDTAQFPYITYSAAIDNLENTVALAGNLWYRSTSWREISQKATQIEAYLSNGGTLIQMDEGYLWIVKGAPFAQRANEVNESVKHIYLALMGNYLSN